MAWDYVKCRIRTESIYFSIKNARKTCKHIDSLNSHLKIVEERISIMPTTQIANIEKEIHNFY